MSTCTLCPDGSPPSLPEALVELRTSAGMRSIPCSDIADYMLTLEELDTCLLLRMTASQECGCEPFLCNPAADICPFRGDGVCGNNNSAACRNDHSDCVDCDPCSELSYTSCTNCTAAPYGCFWCPYNGVCSSYAPLEQSLLGSTSTMPACGMDDFVGLLSTCNETSSVFSDPLFSANQWAYDLINIEPVWREGITGAGVRIRINDDGIDVEHAEFQDKFEVEASCDVYLPVDPVGDFHGTAAASIAAARGNNSMCSVGIAPNANLSSCRASGTPGDVQSPFPDLLTHALDRQDISSNSYGIPSCQYTTRRDRRLQEECPFKESPRDSPCAHCDFEDDNLPLSNSCIAAIVQYCKRVWNYEADTASCMEYLEHFTTCEFSGLPTSYQEQFVKGVQEGRNGLGLVFVFASGNEFTTGADTNFQSLQNSRFVITVGGVGKRGLHASYSTPGASLLVSAPGGDQEFDSNWITADAGGGCGDAHVGTSWAAPVVSGVVALMLEVAPNLTWRDVQGILATTSRPVDLTDKSWAMNAAGLLHSNKYGFGLVDAKAAVDAAQKWTSYGMERFVSVDSDVINLAIADNASALVSSSLDIDEDISVESVVVYLDLSHAARGHLQLSLVSPGNMTSILSPGQRPENTQLVGDQRWKLMTLRSWGESSKGTWTLSAVDIEPGDVTTCVDLPVIFRDSQGVFGCAELAMPGCTQSRTAANACCKCGGGQDSSAVPDVLLSWRLVVYGHNHTHSMPSSEPTRKPTNGPTGRPSAAPISTDETPSQPGIAPVSTAEAPIQPAASPVSTDEAPTPTSESTVRNRFGSRLSSFLRSSGSKTMGGATIATSSALLMANLAWIAFAI